MPKPRCAYGARDYYSDPCRKYCRQILNKPGEKINPDIGVLHEFFHIFLREPELATETGIGGCRRLFPSRDACCV